jgi:hypothetical protein
MEQMMRLSMEAWQTSLAAGTTIANRLPILFDAAVTGSPGALVETQRMAAEKVFAAAMGSFALGTAWYRLALQMSLGRGQVPDPARVTMQLAEAATAPARRACRSNARRLTRKRRRRR